MVSYDGEPPLGGQGIVVRGMRRALLARGHAVPVVTGHGHNALRYPRVTGRGPLDFSLQLNRHSGVITAMAGDVVHAHGGPGGVLLLRSLGAPLVYTAHHTYRQAFDRRSPRRLLSLLEARAYRAAAMVLAVSPSTADAVLRLGVPAARVEVLTNGVDAPAVEAARREPGRVLFAGRWETEKGVLDAVSVMRALLDERHVSSAAVVGTGRLADAVHAAAAGSPIEVLGRLSDSRLHEEYSRAAVVLMPSAYEGLGLVALEAQAAGAVVAGYDVDGLRDAAVDRSLLVTRGDRQALLKVTRELLDEPERLKSIAAHAMGKVRAEHSWDRVAARLEEVYTAVGTSG